MTLNIVYNGKIRFVDCDRYWGNKKVLHIIKGEKTTEILQRDLVERIDEIKKENIFQVMDMADKKTIFHIGGDTGWAFIGDINEFEKIFPEIIKENMEVRNYKERERLKNWKQAKVKAAYDLIAKGHVGLIVDLPIIGKYWTQEEFNERKIQMCRGERNSWLPKNHISQEMNG